MALMRLWLVFAVSLIPSLLHAATLVVVDNSNPPFMYQDAGQAKGLYPSLLQALFKRLGEPVEVQAVPWKRALMLSASTEAGVGGIYKNAQRQQLYDFSEPLFEEKILVYVRRDNSFAFEALDDLAGRKIGTIRGWSYSEAFDQAARNGRILARENISDDANFKMLASGRLDAVLAIEQAGQQTIDRLKLQQIVALGQPLHSNPTYLAFGKNTDRRALLARINTLLHEMQADGSLNELLQQSLSTE
ncbi:MAG: transporter substrate-binding domain-containing protein [Pseudomonadota bacterium]